MPGASTQEVVMIYDKLGKTGLKVSKLCFGSLTLGPLQANLSIEKAAELISLASDKGLNFIDTADLYGNYEHIRQGLKRSRNNWIISSKSYDYDKKGMEASLEKARREMDRDVIDIFMLHETESEHTIRGHWDAVDYLLEQKIKGTIKAVGVSTHRVEGVLGALKFDEIEVIHPIFNYKGLGIEDGDARSMEEALRKACSLGKGIFAMKPLGGGNLISTRTKAFEYLKDKHYVNSVAIGMQSEDELEYNCSMIQGEAIPDDISKSTADKTRSLHIDSWCDGCRSCVNVCGQNALIIKDGKAQVNKEKCILCGYCSASCPQFCIKVV
jgi:aryl-alcohol dehydrogenase-like predicted oxidoreductase